MLLTSTYAPSAFTDIPVLIVCYGSRRIFMLKTNTFSELINNVRQKLGIDASRSVSLETTALDVCRGCRVEIDEEVWPFMRSSLDEVTVIVSGSGSDSEDGEMGSSKSFAPDGFENAPETRSTTERVDDWMEGQSQVPQEMHDRPMSACSQNEVVESLLRHEDEGDNPGKEFLIPEPTRVEENANWDASINRFRVRFDTAEPRPPSEPQEFHTVEQEDQLDQRFQVRVVGPEPEQNAEIKTRGNHTVKKVLAAVCKTFSLDYERAELYIVTHVRDEYGHIKTGRFHCPPNWPLAKCGVTSETELMIRLATSKETTSLVTQRSK